MPLKSNAPTADDIQDEALVNASDYVLRLFTFGEQPARAERLSVDDLGLAIQLTKSRVSESNRFRRGILYNGDDLVMEYSRAPPRWSAV